MTRKFQIVNPRLGDVVILGRFILMEADIKYRKDEVHSPQTGKVTVQCSVDFSHLAGGPEKVKRLLCYYAVEKLKEIFTAPNPGLYHQLEPSEDEYKDLLTIDTSVIENNMLAMLMRTEIEIDERSRTQANRIFISCGQFHPNEKEIGKQIKQLIDSKDGFEGYFAENQQSFEGLTSNIFKALHTSVAFVAVMHRRNQVSEGRYRGSVWVEQEIAIAAFMKQALDMPIEVLAYIQDGIDLEGVRGLITLNPRTFITDEDVMNDLKISLPQFLDKIKPPKIWLIS